MVSESSKKIKQSEELMVEGLEGHSMGTELFECCILRFIPYP